MRSFLLSVFRRQILFAPRLHEVQHREKAFTQRGQGVLNDSWFKTLNYIAFRDLSLTYMLDNSIANKIGMRNVSLTLAGHNLGYLLNTMPNKENPEAVAGTTTAEFRTRQFSGVTSNFTITLRATIGK